MFPNILARVNFSMGCDRKDLLHTTKKAVMNVMSFFSPNGPDVVVLSQNKAASYIYQNNYRNHTGIYQPNAAAHRKDTAKTFLFRGIKKSVSGKLRAVRNA